MRLVVLLAVVLAPLGVGAEPNPWQPGPRPGSAEWQRIEPAITSYCQANPSSACRELVDALGRNPRPGLLVMWRDLKTLGVHVDAFQVVHPYAVVRFELGRWKTLAVAWTEVPY